MRTFYNDAERYVDEMLEGIFYAYKIAGACAEGGASLAEVVHVTQEALGRIRSIGVAIGPCTVPGAGKPTFVLPENEMEIGMGIHGEAGIRRGPRKGGDDLTDMNVAAGEEVSVLVNSLGATPLEELYIIYRRIALLLGRRDAEGLPRPSRGNALRQGREIGMELRASDVPAAGVGLGGPDPGRHAVQRDLRLDHRRNPETRQGRAGPEDHPGLAASCTGRASGGACRRPARGGGAAWGGPGGNRGAEGTRGMESTVGRARWFAQRSRGEPDPGAVSGAIIVKTVIAYLLGER